MMIFYTYIRKYKRGFSLIESAIVLGIVGLVIGGIWVAASSVRANYRYGAVKQAVLLMSKTLQQWLGPFANDNANAANISYAYSIGRGTAITPEWRYRPDAQLHSSSGDVIKIQSYNQAFSGVTQDAYGLVVTTTTSICARVILDLASLPPGDIVQLSSDDQTVTYAPAGFPLSTAQANALCAARDGKFIAFIRWR